MKYLAACVMVKNEERLIREWMAFHRAVGFDHLIIVDHNSTDRTVELIESFGDPSSVTLVRWTGDGLQLEAFSSVATRYRKDFYWCAFLDCDEFFYPAQGDLKEVMSRYEDCSVVGAHWLVYGSSGFETIQPGYVTETYLRRAEIGFPVNRHVKCVVRLQHYMHPVTSHYFWGVGPVVDEHRNPMPNEAPHGYLSDREPTCDVLRVNHYYTRSLGDYHRKINRGLFLSPDYGGPTYEAKMEMYRVHDRNEVEDRSALRYSRLMRFYAELPPPARRNWWRRVLGSG